MRLRNLLVALVIAAGLGGAVWYAIKHPPGSGAKATPDTSVKVVNIPEDQIRQIEVKKRDGTVLTLVHENRKWSLAGKENFPADQDAVSGLAGALAPLSADFLENKPSDLAGYGLTQPALTVTVQRTNGKSEQVILGDDVPGGSQTYLQRAGDSKVYLAPTSLRSSLDKQVNDLRDKRLMTFDNDKVTRIQLDAKKQTIEFGKNNQNEWQILKPGPYRADSFSVEDLLRKLKDAKMDLSLSADDAKKADAQFAGGQIVATARVTDAAATQTLEVRKNKDAYFAKSSAVKGTFKVTADLGTGLDKSIDDFRNKKLFDFGFNDPSKIEIHNGAAASAYVKSGPDWKANGKTMDSASVQSVIDQLRDLSAAKFVETGLTVPTVDITVTSSDGKRVEKVEFSKASDGYIARRANEPALYQLASKSVDDILKGTKEIKESTAHKK
jgi:hypothetical protein